MCISLVVFDTICLVSSILSGSYNIFHSPLAYLPELCREEFDEGIPLEKIFFHDLSLSLHCPAMGLCISSYLLQATALKTAKRDSDLWGHHSVIGSHFIAVALVVFGFPKVYDLCSQVFLTT